MNDVIIGISTYNEIENLPRLVEQIDQHLPNADILVVDDNSPDGTGHWSEQQAEDRADFFCIRRPGKLGLGTATVATLRFAIEKGYTYVVNMDADLSHPAEALPRLVAAMQGPSGDVCDVAVGSRYVSGGHIVGWPLRRQLMSRCVNGFARLVLRLPTKDCSGSFRCYRVSQLEHLDLAGVRSRGYSFFEEILWSLRHTGARFSELPITFHDREKGKSKINLREALVAVKIIASLPFCQPALRR